MAARAPGPRWEQGACCCRRGREQSGRQAGGHGSQRAAAHHRLTRGPRRGGGGPAARAEDAAGRLRARGLGPRLLGWRGGSSGGWSSAPRTGSPMAAAPRKTWSRGCDQERPGIAARRSVLLLLFVPRFLTRCLTLGVPVPQGVPRHSEAQALGSFREAGALRLGKGNFHQARSSPPRSAEPRAPGQQLPSGLRCPLGEVEGRGLKRDPALGKAAPPLSLLASAPRLYPSLWRQWMGRTATLQQRRLLPLRRGCSGGHSRPPPLLSFRLARKDPIHRALG